MSIIFVSYNNFDDIERLAASLHASAYPNTETILIDNGSHDGTVDQFASEFPDLLVAHADPLNPGYGRACNRGASLATGDYIVFLNCDVELEPDAIDELVASLLADPSIGAVMAKLLVRGQQGIVNASGGASHFLGFSWNANCLLLDHEPDAVDVRDVGYACGTALAVRRSAFDQLGGFDENCFMYVEDADLSWRLRIAGYRTVVASAARVHHDYAFFTGDRRFCFYAERNRLAMVLKCYRWYSLMLLLPIALGIEIVVLGYAIRERWLREKLAAYVSVARSLPRILVARRRVQSLRSRTGPRWTDQLSAGMDSPHIRHPIVKIGNVFLRAVWIPLRRIVS